MANTFFSPFGGTSNPSGGGAYGAGNVSSAASSVSDIFGYFGTEAKAAGDEAEQQEYSLAEELAQRNEQYTKDSTAIKEAQISREVTQSLGKTTADVAGAGFAESGSALDILRSSASQGALTKAVAGEQGLITEAGYAEQAQSYALMASAAGAASGAERLAGYGDLIGAGLNAAPAIGNIATMVAAAAA